MPEPIQNRKRVTLLGAGYVGRALARGLMDSCEVQLTSRAGSPHAERAHDALLRFNLQTPETWDFVLDADFLVWTFPAATCAEDIAMAAAFYRKVSARGIPTLVMASTSSYRTDEPDALLDESALLDLTQPRVEAEEILRTLGCFVLTLAGIYGPGRDPVQWLRRGLVKNGESFINLIHVADIVAIVRAWLARPCQGLRLNASDGRHRRWHELIQDLKKYSMLEADFNLPNVQAKSTQSKRVSNAALKADLYAGPFHRYPEDDL